MLRCSWHDHAEDAEARWHRRRPDRARDEPPHEHARQRRLRPGRGRSRRQPHRHRAPLHQRGERDHDRRCAPGRPRRMHRGDEGRLPGRRRAAPRCSARRSTRASAGCRPTASTSTTSTASTRRRRSRRASRAIEGCRDAGKIRHVGLSEVSVEQIERAREIVPIAAVQNHYNLAERGSEDVVDYCAREGIVFVPFFPLRGDGGPRSPRSPRRAARRPGSSPSPGCCGVRR